MPELPEVETVRRRLVPVLEGRTLERVEILDARLVRPFDPDEVAAELQGERVTELGRRGKYLIVSLESGRALLVHLRMTGTLLLRPDAGIPEAAWLVAPLRAYDPALRGCVVYPPFFPPPPSDA